MDCLSRQNSSLIGPKNPAKFENDCISRSVHILKIPQPNLMILVSFSSAEDVLSNDVKKYDIFGLQGTENPPFRFFRDTRWYNCTPAGAKIALRDLNIEENALFLNKKVHVLL